MTTLWDSLERFASLYKVFLNHIFETILIIDFPYIHPKRRFRQYIDCGLFSPLIGDFPIFQRD